MPPSRLNETIAAKAGGFVTVCAQRNAPKCWAPQQTNAARFLLARSEKFGESMPLRGFHHFKGEQKMAVVLQVVSKPNPGSDMAKILEMVKEAAVLWRKP
jgi:hypothetical protein